MKYEKEFPLFKTKVEGIAKKFNLSDLNDRKAYFEAKAGDDIAKLKKYFDEGKTFIVYLLGKNIADASDWAFLREVAAEPPCLSLADCSKRSKGTAEMGDEVTLAYPALVALRQARRAENAAEKARVLHAAKGSRMPAVRRLVERLERE